MKRIAYFIPFIALLLSMCETCPAQILGSKVYSDSILVRATNWGDKVTVGPGKTGAQHMIRIQVISGNGILGIAREDDTARTQVSRCVIGEDAYIPMFGAWFRFKNLVTSDTCLVYREIY